jgi:spoIIIJ-associated protein
MKFEEFNGKDLEELKQSSLAKLNLTEHDCIITSIENKGSLFKGKTYNIKIYKLTDVAEEIKKYLQELLKNMNIEATFETKIRDEQINIKMFSDKNAILIGKNGQTLTSLQIMIRQHIYREIGSYPYILLDVENYKEKQIKNLEYLAKKLAKEVIQTKQTITMEDMNSYERRIVHNVLTTYKEITTNSEGEEPNRHIVIKFKED